MPMIEVPVRRVSVVSSRPFEEIVRRLTAVPLSDYMVTSFEGSLISRIEVTVMLLETIFAPFVKERPICVMAEPFWKGSWMPNASMPSLPAPPGNNILARSCFPLWCS
jgi:hypothetical protein